MRILHRLGLSFCLIGGAVPALADKPPVDCGRKSLANAVEDADPGDTLQFTGVCAGPIVVTVDGLSIVGAGSTAAIDGGGRDAITIAGASRVKLSGFEVRNALNGVVGTNGAHVTLTNLNVHDNIVFGISMQTASSAILTGVTVARNGLHGLDLQTGSAATINGTFTSTANRVFGINANGSSLTFSNATATISRNALGIQVATAANAFINDSRTTLNVTDNQATGLTVVSGAHMVSFGGVINASGNGVNGVSVNSKGGLDLDAGSQLNASNNGDGVVLQQTSVMTVFNNPQFSGVPGFSTINSTNNRRSGVLISNGATLTLSNQARVISTGNGTTGLTGDNGVGITLVNSTITGNIARDIALGFGTRADVRTSTFGTFTCDATVLLRGTTGVTCPR